MLTRLLGMETEYAIRFSPREGYRHPGNQRIYQALTEAISARVQTRAGARQLLHQQRFLENGGAVAYEFLSYAVEGGLVEGATPECRTPGQMLLYQKAQDALIRDAIPTAERALAQQGFRGELGVLKNCRDAEGHVYGVQENFEARIADGPSLLAWRAALVLLFPVVAVFGVVGWSLVLALLVFYLGLHVIVGLFALLPVLDRVAERFFDPETPIDARVGRVLFVVEASFWSPIVLIFALLHRALLFRPQRRALTAFLVSRPVFSGSGTLQGGALALSEKATETRRLTRWSILPSGRPIYDSGNLIKQLLAPTHLNLKGYLSLFHRRQRLQLGLADANLAHVAEYLKIGTTALILDMAEAGHLDDAPRLRAPLDALRAFHADPGLTARAELQGGDSCTALELQRFYLERAERFLEEASAPSMEAHEVVRLWREALDALRDEPDALIGRVDWITKRFLLDTAGADLSDAARKKIDLRYHDLADGYLARLEAAGEAPTLVSEAEIEAAIHEPPGSTPAKQRGRLIRSLADSDARVRVSWSEVRVGGPVGGKVIRLDDYR